MKLTFSTLACPNWTLDQIVECATANGIEGIDFRGLGSEMDITALPDFTTQLPATLKQLHEHHLQMPCLNSSITLLTPAATKWESMLDEARRYAELAGKTKTPFLRLFGGLIPAGMTRDQARDLARSHLRQIANITLPHGCKPLLETHDSWVHSHHVLDLLGDFKPEEAGVLWDLEHPWLAGESPAATAAALNKRIEHTHVKDTIRRDEKSIPALLGEGEQPLANCFDALKSISYDGWICLETEKRWHPEGPDPELSIPQFASYMRQITG